MLASSSRNVARGQACARIARVSVPAQAASRGRQAWYATQAPSIFDEPIAREKRGPWRRAPITSFRDPQNQRSPLAKYNLEINKLAGQKDSPGVFRLCQKMKLDGVKPDLFTYHLLLQTCGEITLHREAWAIFEDMIAMGIRPDVQVFEQMLHAVRFRPISETWAVWDTMHEYGIRPDEGLFERLIVRLANGRNCEAALQQLAVMTERAMAPTLKTMNALIHVACFNKQPRLALDLARAYDTTSVRRLPSQTWMRVLIASSESLFMEGVEAAWEKTVKEDGIAPDEGCCTNVLHTAGRHANSSLGLEALGALKNMNIVWEEHHFAPVVEAFCGEGNIREAIVLLQLMRDSGLTPLMETAYPIFRMIRTDVDKVDEAFGVLETLKEEGKNVDVVALNVVIQACVALGDLQRALGTYKAAGDLGITPSVDTYNTLLSACVVAQHRELGDRLLVEMREAQIKPNARTYERLIVLCLTQPTYEDAFFYLEEMKSGGILPPQTVYEALIRRCVAVGDTRYNLAVEEMLEQGYEMPQALQYFIESGGKESERSERPRRRSTEGGPEPAPSVDT